MPFVTRLAAAAAIAFGIVAAPLAAAAPDADYVPLGAPADAPQAFLRLCEQDRATCLAGTEATASADVPGASAAIDLDRMVADVNIAVNQGVRQVTDPDATGQDDVWARPHGKRAVGDCEDVAIEKRMRLVAAGFPSSRLFYGVAYRSGRGLHVVLIARLEHGDVVLDSATSDIKAWRKVRYSWLRFQTPADPMTWRRSAVDMGAAGA